ncbi:MAG: PilZ domain-containing protein [Deltaproteobacteria bacterium]|nr:PilZ domain-containing protein [Deltaproteobacteria bacterium]
MSASSSAMGVRAWIADDGELGALRTLLKERQISYADVDEEPPCEVDLLVSNPRRALDVERSRNRLAPRMHIVMAHELTRTMRQRLQRSACDFIVDENVHPSALRLLLEYALYRGPERREGTRVPMGTEVKLKVGWRQRKGTLVQLSERGCGIMLDAEISGDDISLRLPAAWGGKRIEVPVRVVDQSEQKGVGRIVSFIFRRVDMPTRRALRNAMKQAATEFGRLDPSKGGAESVQAPKKKVPAKSKARSKVSTADTPRAQLAQKKPARLAQKKPARPTLALPGRQSPTKTTAAELPTDDRRHNMRAHYMRRVIATHEGQAHVVIGQDISVGGMRIGKEPGIMVGDDLKLALYGVGSEERVIVSASIVRDDGLAGLGVKFVDVSPDTHERLIKLIDAIPILGRSKNGQKSRPSVVVSEVLEHQGPDDSN